MSRAYPTGVQFKESNKSNEQYKRLNTKFISADGSCVYGCLSYLLKEIIESYRHNNDSIQEIKALFHNKIENESVLSLLEFLAFGGYSEEEYGKREMITRIRELLMNHGFELIPNVSKAEFLNEIEGHGGLLVFSVFIRLFKIKSLHIFYVNQDGISINKYTLENLLEKSNCINTPQEIMLRFRISEIHYDVLEQRTEPPRGVPFGGSVDEIDDKLLEALRLSKVIY